MKVFAVLALCLAAVSAERRATTLKHLSAKGVDTRIVNGFDALEGNFPYQVAVHQHVGNITYFCGGALISDSWVITAGHCVDDVDTFTLRFGSIDPNGGISQIVNGSNAIQHADYDPVYLYNDIAVIKLDTPVSGTNISPVSLPATGDVVETGDYAIVSGWGKTKDDDTTTSDTLRFILVPAIGNAECEEVFHSMIVNSTLCCDGLFYSTCDGDSGSPLVKDKVHVGIASFVSDTGCEKGQPIAFLRTESMLPWIKEKTGLE